MKQLETIDGKCWKIMSGAYQRKLEMVFEKTQFKKTSSLYPSLYGFCFKLQQNFSSDAVFFQQLG